MDRGPARCSPRFGWGRAMTAIDIDALHLGLDFSGWISPFFRYRPDGGWFITLDESSIPDAHGVVLDLVRIYLRILSVGESSRQARWLMSPECARDVERAARIGCDPKHIMFAGPMSEREWEALRD